jgi:hypothetical protein
MTDQDDTTTRPDDTEGHARLYSDRNVEVDVQPVDHEDDTEGHGACANRADAESAEGDDDTEGHARIR